MTYLSLKESMAVVEEHDTKYQFVFSSSRKVKSFAVDPLVKKIIQTLEDPMTHEDFTKEMSREFDPVCVQNAMNALEHEGIVRLRPDKRETLDRQLLFIDEYTNSWNETLQKQKDLEQSSVLVLGLGGVGSWIAKGAYQLGIGTIGLLDPDRVELSNLNRQCYSPSDIDKLKIDAMKNQLLGKNAHTYTLKIRSAADLKQIPYKYDLIVNCMDAPSVQQTSKWVDIFANETNTPYIVAGGYNLHIGMIGPMIIPGKTRTLDDFLTYQKQNDSLANFQKLKDVEEGGNLGPVAGTIANLQSMEMFKYFTGIGENNLNRFAEFNVMNYDIEWRNF